MLDKNLSSGLSLCYTLQGHKQRITRVAWSPDGRILASSSEDWTIRLWNTNMGHHIHTLSAHNDNVNSLAWSPNGRILASASDDATIKFWDTLAGRCVNSITEHKVAVTSMAFLPDGQTVIFGFNDGTIKLWDKHAVKYQNTLVEHAAAVKSLIYAPTGRFLVSGSDDEVVLLWDMQMNPPQLVDRMMDSTSIAWSEGGQFLAIGSNTGIIDLMKVRGREQQSANKNLQLVSEIRLEGHTDLVTGLSFSSDGQLLASKSRDGTVRLWRTNDWKTIRIIKEPTSEKVASCLAFHPTDLVLATLGEEDTVIRVWNLDTQELLNTPHASPSCLYRNAKVVLVGDSGVGKSGLELVLTGKSFAPTESTHGRHVWILENSYVKFDEDREEIREILLWDMAGQPGYRLIHQLHLNEVTLALVIMDARSETDPFAGVHHWEHALRVAQRFQSTREMKLKKFLISARIDRGGIKASHQRIDALVRDLDFDGFFETSAKEGWGILELVQAIKEAIDWDALPKISSTYLFQEIKSFLVAEKEAGRVLSVYSDLYQAFLSGRRREDEDVKAEFGICIEQMETQGLIRRLSTGDLVLLQPELIDAYASALLNAVRDQPDGLGSIKDEQVQAGDFSMSADERLSDSEQERYLLVAMIEDLLRNEIALRERTHEGTYLVFPSQTTRENHELPDPEKKAVIFRFEGPIQNIYATLAVRLSHSGLFELKELWHNAITYKSETGGTCGLILYNLSEAYAELALFFDTLESQEIRLHFEDYVHEHLRNHALADSIKLQRIFACSNCGVQFTHAQVLHRRQRGFNSIICSVCETQISIEDRDQDLGKKSLIVVSAMNRSADAQREHEVSTSIHNSSRPQNPYYEMSGMRNPEMFVGRTKLLRRLFPAIANKQSISLVGPIRIGKTSLLQYISRQLTQKQLGNQHDFIDYLFVLLDLGEFLYKTSEEFLQDVSKHIVTQSCGALELPQRGRGMDVFLDVLRQATRKKLHIVLLMDSFDNIVRNKSFDPNFLEFLRSMASVGAISYVTTSITPLAEVCHDALIGSPFFNIFGFYQLGTLTREEAQQLVRGPSQLAGCPFTDSEVAWVLSLAGRHPFFIQRLCYFLFEEKIADNNTTDLNKVKGQAYNDFLPHFNYICERQNQNTIEQDQTSHEEVSSVGAHQRQFPELGESILFRDFVLEKAGIYSFQLNIEELKKALSHLDDLLSLGSSNLRYLISVTKRLKGIPTPSIGVGRAISEVLKEALKRLSGKGMRTDKAPDWLSYNILYYSYFYKHHMSTQQIATRIGLSTRQFYQVQERAIKELLSVLLETEIVVVEGEDRGE